MILKSFHVRVFRNIVDSGPIEVVGSTCLVGKNEAGKSSTIEAPHRLNPARPMPLVLLDDYPRWLKKQHEISDQIKDAVPISAVFQFSKEEFKSIETQFGEGVLSTNEIIAKRKYTGDMLIELPIDQARFIELFSVTHIDPPLRAKVSAAKTGQELLQSLDSVAA